MQLTAETATWIEMQALANGFRTQAELANACERSPALISLVLAGKRPATDELLQRLESVFKLQPGTIRERHERTAKIA